MKWFGVPVDENDPDALANECIRYLKSDGDRPEKWTALNTLIKMITRGELDNNLIRKAISIRWKPIYMRIATKADKHVLDMLLDENIKDQVLYANMAYNRNLTPEQAARILELLDDSNRADTTRKKLYKVLDKSE